MGGTERIGNGAGTEWYGIRYGSAAKFLISLTYQRYGRAVRRGGFLTPLLPVPYQSFLGVVRRYDPNPAWVKAENVWLLPAHGTAAPHMPCVG